ncbi:hypothetical protein K443DRAFT_135047 [Laccaria amethystina LaAM-08-1]|uniref:Uncharacterized protein n=1 Tax=Laccaria amethystina LaAM-08-1 TaxID=1095629 RepID=A0A0C9WX86_9AGAR|nr:hypothetical protein K443DRAFT_135047 [Laccaria amethystina LaAM-08-1]
METVPPPYTSTTTSGIPSNASPPSYTFPTSFTIGGTRTDSLLVNIPQVQGHLALLHAFAQLRTEIEVLEVSLTDTMISDMPADKEKRWAWFVALAVERFDRWCQNLKSEDAAKPISEILPPVDVLMVWHSYMLNPRWYAEDCLRLPPCQNLKLVGLTFSAALENIGPLLTLSPSRERVELWESRCSLPFSYRESAAEMRYKTLSCPHCSHPISIRLMNEAGTGYFQQGFAIQCARKDCDSPILTKERLALKKLAADIARQGTTVEACLPGTVLSTTAESDLEAGKRIKLRAQTLSGSRVEAAEKPTSGVDEDLCFALMKEADFFLPKLRAKLGTQRIVRRIMSAYNDDKIYSVDLVGAVLRQGTFVFKMVDLGWTQPGFFDSAEDKVALQHAIARYHAFMDLMTTSPASFFVPTLDIDLVWHTHQLIPHKYGADCQRYVKRFIDHDDKIENLQLAAAFDITCNAWKERFNVKYTYCGCPLPGDTIGQRLSRLICLTHPPEPPSQLVPPDRPDLLAATHASDHNAVHFKPKNKRAHMIAVSRYSRATQKRQKALAKASKAAQKAAKNGRGLPGYRATVPSHAGAFLIPVPLYFGGYGGAGLGGCVATGVIVACGGGITDVCYMLFRGYVTNLYTTTIRETVLVRVPLGVEGVEEVGAEVGAGEVDLGEVGARADVQEVEDALAEPWVGDAVEVCVSNITS